MMRHPSSSTSAYATSRCDISDTLISGFKPLAQLLPFVGKWASCWAKDLMSAFPRSTFCEREEAFVRHPLLQT